MFIVLRKVAPVSHTNLYSESLVAEKENMSLPLYQRPLNLGFLSLKRDDAVKYYWHVSINETKKIEIGIRGEMWHFVLKQIKMFIAIPLYCFLAYFCIL